MSNLDNPKPPLIVTGLLSPETQDYFDELRRRHFPADRNHLKAHLTLFHALPASREVDVRELLTSFTDDAPYEATVSGVRSLGRGVAFRVDSPRLGSTRRRIADHVADELTAQDRQKHEFHITVQNNVDPSVARALLDELQSGFEPITTSIIGLGFWRYIGGPWEPIATFAFSGSLDT